MEFNVTGFDGDTGNNTGMEQGSGIGWSWNESFRVLVLLLFAVRVILFFFINGEFSSIWTKLREVSWRQPLAIVKGLPLVFVFDLIVYLLSLYIAISHPRRLNERTLRSCVQWQTSAVTITLAWLNLLFYMRLNSGVGKYVILFHDVCLTFLAVSSVFSILLLAFAFGFHILLSNQRKFEGSHDSMLKTMIMMAGEIEYGEIFFKELPPKDFSNGWDQGSRTVPFPTVTYAMFVIFFFMVSIVALNVLVGLTVDDIRNFLENADLWKLSMRLKYILETERHYMQKRKGREQTIDSLITKQSHFNPFSNDLISKGKIWEKIEKKQEDRRKKAEIEQERKNVKEMINSQTTKLKKLMSRRWKAVTKMMKESESQNQRRRPLQKFSSIHSVGNGISSVWSSFEENDEAEDFDELIQNARSMITYKAPAGNLGTPKLSARIPRSGSCDLRNPSYN